MPVASLIIRPSKTGPVYYIQFWQGGKPKRFRASDSLQIAKQVLRDFENAQARGEQSHLPTRTPIADVLDAYVQHIRTAKTPKSAQTDIYYLRTMFGPVCDALNVTSRTLSVKSKKRPPKPGQDRRRKAPVIEADSLEQIATAQIAAFISGQMASRGLAPKTANRFRDTCSALFGWAMSQRGLRLPHDRNPAAAVAKYKEPAPVIRFLTLSQVEAQLAALADNVQMQTMVAVLIFAGLRREELLWLEKSDLDLAGGPHGLLRVRAKSVDGENWQPKTKINRAVPVSSALRHYLDKWQLKNAKSSWLFPSPQGKRWDPDNFSANLRGMNASKAMMWADGTPYGSLDYRHTFGSLLAMKGESLFKISKLMGNIRPLSYPASRREWAESPGKLGIVRAAWREVIPNTKEFNYGDKYTFCSPPTAGKPISRTGAVDR
jgi:integrase